MNRTNNLSSNGVNNKINETSKNFIHINMFGKKVCSYETHDDELIAKLSTINKDNMHIVAKEIIPILFNPNKSGYLTEEQIKQLEHERVLKEIETRIMRQLDIQLEKRSRQKQLKRKERLNEEQQNKEYMTLSPEERFNKERQTMFTSMENFVNVFEQIDNSGKSEDFIKMLNECKNNNSNDDGDDTRDKIDEDELISQLHKYVERHEIIKKKRMDNKRHNEQTMLKLLKSKLTTNIPLYDLCDEEDYL
jgi:hypothetical protein